MNFYNLYQGDCLDVMSTFKDNEFDLCLTDPPYGILKNSFPGQSNTSKKALGKTTKFKDVDWDNYPLSSEQFQEIQRISKNQIIFGGNHFSDILPVSRGWMVWDKRRMFAQNDQADCELIWTSYDVAPRVCYHLWMGMMKDSEKGNERYHPTQKPVAVIEWLIDTVASDVNTIIDPFIGSGTTMFASQNRRKDCVGIEISDEYCNIVKRRCFTRTFLDRQVDYNFMIVEAEESK